MRKKIFSDKKKTQRICHQQMYPKRMTKRSSGNQKEGNWKHEKRRKNMVIKNMGK